MPRARALDVAVGLAAGAVAVLGAQAAGRGPLGPTTGPIVAGGAVVTLLLALALERMRLPRRSLRRIQLFLLVAQALHAAGHVHALYTVLPRYDDLFHLASGGVGALLLLDLARGSSLVRAAGPGRAASYVVVAVFAAAGAWEVLEWTGDLAFSTREQDDLHDTMLDMVVGLVGGVLAAYAWAWGATRRPRRAMARAASAVAGVAPRHR